MLEPRFQRSTTRFTRTTRAAESSRQIRSGRLSTAVSHSNLARAIERRTRCVSDSVSGGGELCSRSLVMLPPPAACTQELPSCEGSLQTAAGLRHRQPTRATLLESEQHHKRARPETPTLE